MKPNTVESEPVEPPAGLVTLAELAAEGFGWGGQFIRTPGDAVDALARRLAALVVLDDLGRRCVSRAVARDLFAARAAAEAARTADAERRQAARARATRRPPRGVPWTAVPEGISPVVAMTAAARAADPRRRVTPMEETWNGESTYRSLTKDDAS